MSGLRALGVSEVEERLYRQVLRTPGTSPSLLAAELGMSVAEVRDAAAGLSRLGLAASTGEDDRVFPTPPAMALQQLQLRRRQSLLQREQELDVARAEAQRLIEEFEVGKRRESGVEIVEQIQGKELIAQHFEMLQRTAEHEIMFIDRPPYAMSGRENPTELETLARGVAYRVIYDPTALEQPGEPEGMLEFIAAGEQARILDGIPLKTCIVDRRLALIPLNLGQPTLAGSLVVHESSLLDALIVLFETLWREAVPLTLEGFGNEATGVEADRHLLALMSAGLNDQRLARQLGISSRTLARRVNRMLEELDAESRFQAGVIAARRGLV